MPNGRTVTITNPHLGISVSATFVDGGLDPVALPATAGDTLSLTVQTTTAGSVSYMRAVPKDGPPIVIRTSPPPHKRDVPLNSRMVIVFSQPIDPATLTQESVQLQHNGIQVPGQVAVGDPAHLTATFAPSAPLAALTEYELGVTEGVLGLDGAPLNAPVAVPFTTAAPGSAAHFTVGGTVSGLVGSGLVLHQSGADPLTVTENGSVTFGTALASGSAYRVTVFAQPDHPAQTCTVHNATGTVVSANVTTVEISCTIPAAGLVFASVSVGGWHNCGVTSDGAAYCWGENLSGALGNGTTTNSAIPVPVAGGLTFKSVSAGWRYTCGVTTAGALYCWGGNPLLPFASRGARSPTEPIPVAAGLTFASVSAGDWHICGLTPAGAAYCWGDGILAAGGVPDTIGFAAVAGGLTFTSVSAGDWHTCGLTTSGAAYCWGDNTYAELGTGYGPLSTGVPWPGPDVCINPNNLGETVTLPCSRVPVAVAGGLTFRQVSTEGESSCGLTTTGAAYCWGASVNGWLGIGAGPFDACLVDCSLNPRPVVGQLVFSSHSTGELSSCALTAAGDAYCWGDNSDGALGDGTTVSSTSPVAVVGGLTFAMVSADKNLNGGASICGVTRAGVAYCWGYGYYGQLGAGSTNGSTVPVKVAGQP